MIRSKLLSLKNDSYDPDLSNGEVNCYFCSSSDSIQSCSVCGDRKRVPVEQSLFLPLLLSVQVIRETLLRDQKSVLSGPFGTAPTDSVTYEPIEVNIRVRSDIVLSSTGRLYLPLIIETISIPESPISYLLFDTNSSLYQSLTCNLGKTFSSSKAYQIDLVLVVNKQEIDKLDTENIHTKSFIKFSLVVVKEKTKYKSRLFSFELKREQ